MAVSDSIAAWILPFIAPITLYFAKNVAIHNGWLSAPSHPDNETDRAAFVALRAVLEATRGMKEDISEKRKELSAILNDIKGSLERLENQAKHMRDDGTLIYQHIPTPHTSSAAVHLDG